MVIKRFNPFSKHDWDKVGDKIEDAAEDVGDAIKDTAEDVGDKIKGEAESAGRKLEPLAEQALDAAEDAVKEGPATLSSYSSLRAP